MCLTLFTQDLRVGNKYRIGRKIGSGSFGDIYLGTLSTSPSSILNKTANLSQSPTSHNMLIPHRHQHHLR
jgi:hypothetical protein